MVKRRILRGNRNNPSAAWLASRGGRWILGGESEHCLATREVASGATTRDRTMCTGHLLFLHCDGLDNEYASTLSTLGTFST